MTEATLQPHVDSGPLNTSQRRIAMFAISLAGSMATLDTSMTNTALPTMAHDLGVSGASVIGVVTIYQLVMVAVMLPLAALGGRIGHRRVFMTGLVVFIAASLLCGLATSLIALEAARAIQGLSAAALMGSNVALVRHIYPSKQLGRGLGINALIMALSLAGGPVLASALLTVTNWHWLFLINVPLGLVSLLLAWKTLPTDSQEHASFDGVSAVLCALALGLFVHALDRFADQSDGAIPALVLAFAAMFVLLRKERGHDQPIVPVDLFRNRVIASSTMTTVLAFATQGATLVAMPFMLQQTLARPVGEVGLLIAPWPIMGALMAPIAGSLSDRISSSLLGGIGLACLATGVLSMGLMPATAPTWLLLLCMALCGFGFGLFYSPSQRAIMTSAPKNRSGAASGAVGVARLLGQTMGASIVAWCLAHATTNNAAGTGEVHALWIAAALAATGSASSLAQYVMLKRASSGGTNLETPATTK